MSSRKSIQIVTIISVILIALCHSATAGVVCYSRDSYAENFIRAVQATIEKEGIDPGPIDGAWGFKTESGLKQYQINMGLQPTRMLDGPTLRMMFGEKFKPEDYGLEENASMTQEIFDEYCR